MNIPAILIPLIVGVLICALNAWVNIKIKFSPTASHAKQEAMRMFFWVAISIHLTYCVWLLTSELVSSEPVTRQTVRNLALGLFGTLCDVGCMLLQLMLSMIRQMISEFRKNVVS